MKAGSVPHAPGRPRTAPELPLAAIPQHHFEPGRWPPLWWVGCHGGAGTTTLATLTGLGVDFGAAWPLLPPAMPAAHVVLVCRADARGAWAATGAVEQWRRRSGMSYATQILGVVAVAASARRPPRIAAERLQLLSGWIPQLWRVGWIEALLAADDPHDVGMPPDVETVRNAILHKLQETPEGKR